MLALVESPLVSNPGGLLSREDLHPSPAFLAEKKGGSARARTQPQESTGRARPARRGAEPAVLPPPPEPQSPPLSRRLGSASCAQAARDSLVCGAPSLCPRLWHAGLDQAVIASGRLRLQVTDICHLQRCVKVPLARCLLQRVWVQVPGCWGRTEVGGHRPLDPSSMP